MQQVGFRSFDSHERPDPAIVARLAAFRSVDLSDAMNRANTMIGLRPVYTPIRSMAGTAVTVSVPAGSINMIKMGMERCRPGDVLVVNAQGETTFALWGGNVSRGTQARGAVGLVIDGAIRDVSEIRALDWPVHARAIATAAAVVDTPRGEVNVPIACGSAVVNPGDIIVADEDGIVVVPPAAAEWVLDKAQALVDNFAALQPVLLRGEVTNIAKITSDFAAQGMAIDDSANERE